MGQCSILRTCRTQTRYPGSSSPRADIEGRQHQGPGARTLAVGIGAFLYGVPAGTTEISDLPLKSATTWVRFNGEGTTTGTTNCTKLTLLHAIHA